MKIKKIIYIFTFFVLALSFVSSFSINKILSNAQNFENNNISQNLKQDFDNLNADTKYKMETIEQNEVNMSYTISYPIFKNIEINTNIYNNIKEVIDEFRNEFKNYVINSENDKVYLTLETDVGFFKEDLVFIRFFINRNYLEYPNHINFYKTYIFNLKSGKEMKISEIFNDYSQLLSKKSVDYFKNNYGIKIDFNSEEYRNIEPKMENYQNIFIKNNFFEFIIFDYKKGEDVIIRINFDEVSPFIKEIVPINETNSEINNSSTTESIINQMGNNKTLEEISIETTTESSTEIITENLAKTTTEDLEKASFLDELHKVNFQKVPNEFLNNILPNIQNTFDLAKKAEEEKQLEENRGIDPNKPMIALTFDDGPNYKVTNRILDILEKNNARATFFVVGRRIDKDAEVLKRMDSLGNQIGNHTFNHKNLSKISSEEIIFEVESINKKLEKYIGKKADIVRIPYGDANENVLQSVDYPIIMWNVDTQDWKTKNSNSTIQEIRKNAKDGAIILMHDLYETTADACETIIPELINKGFQLVTIDEMMKYKNIELNAGNKYYNGIKKD